MCSAAHLYSVLYLCACVIPVCPVAYATSIAMSQWLDGYPRTVLSPILKALLQEARFRAKLHANLVQPFLRFENTINSKEMFRKSAFPFIVKFNHP